MVPPLADLATKQLPGNEATMLSTASANSPTAPCPCHPKCRAFDHRATTTTVLPTSATDGSRSFPASTTTDRPGLHPTSTSSSVRGVEELCIANPVDSMQCPGPATSPR